MHLINILSPSSTTAFLKHCTASINKPSPTVKKSWERTRGEKGWEGGKDIEVQHRRDGIKNGKEKTTYERTKSCCNLLLQSKHIYLKLSGMSLLSNTYFFCLTLFSTSELILPGNTSVDHQNIGYCSLPPQTYPCFPSFTASFILTRFFL